MVRCFAYVGVKCKLSFQSENGVKWTVYRADKFLQVNMTLLTVLIIVHEYIPSRFLPYHHLSFETAVAHAQLIEILSELSSSSIPCVITSDR